MATVRASSARTEGAKLLLWEQKFPRGRKATETSASTAGGEPSGRFAVLQDSLDLWPIASLLDLALRQRLLEFFEPVVCYLRSVELEFGKVFERSQFLQSCIRHLGGAQPEF